MSDNFKPQQPLQTVLLKNSLKSAILALFISFFLFIVPLYLFLSNQINTDIQQVEELTYKTISNQFANGWNEQQLNQLYKELRQKLPDTEFYLQKMTPSFQVKDTLNFRHNQFKELIRNSQTNEETYVQKNLLDGNIQVAIPILFKKDCLNCHLHSVQEIPFYEGQMAAKLYFKAPISIDHLSTSQVVTFMLIYMAIFSLLTILLSVRVANRQIIAPINNLVDQLLHLRLNLHDRNIRWKRTPQSIYELEELDKHIAEHIHAIEQMYQRLDELILSKKHAHILHESHFHDMLAQEIKRSQRYQHSFSLLLVRAVNLQVLNASAKNLEQSSPGVKYMIFGEVLKNDSRETDLTFRLETDLFAILAPETNLNGALALKKDIFHRLNRSKIPTELCTSQLFPEYQFTIQIGVANFEYSDSDNSLQIIEKAQESLNNSSHAVGKYPQSDDNLLDEFKPR